MALYADEHAEAVIFFEEGKISREMLYSEFEAILDGFIPIPEVASSTVKAVFLRINRELHIRSAVFFLIAFDAEGFADRRWNVPLEQLADNSAPGPDLGAGAISLACYSQCCIAWHQQHLWDPDMSPGNNHFSYLRKLIKRNRLAIVIKQPEAEESPAPASDSAIDASTVQVLGAEIRQQYEKELRLRVAQHLKEQRLRATTLISQHKQAVQALQLEHHKRLEGVNREYNNMKKLLEEEKALNEQLKETISGQASKLEGMREYFEHKVQSAKVMETAQLDELRKNYELEFEAKLESATTELKEQMQLRDIELMYRNEQIASRDEEVERLREEQQQLLAESGDQLLEKLQQQGINFVAYHPGAGHMTIPLGDMSDYLDDSLAYVADKCGVSTALYRMWLDHYQAPVCQALKANGDLCGEHLQRVEEPANFHAGESDRCIHHQTSPTQVFAAVNP
jgi:hypothetical protein